MLDTYVHEFYMNILSWPPRSSTACTKCACSAVVHRILGALALLFPPPAGLAATPPATGPPPVLAAELFLNPWVWFGWCSRCCTCWRLWCCIASALFASAVSTSPSSSLGFGISPPASGDGGLMWSERSGAPAVAVVV